MKQFTDWLAEQNWLDSTEEELKRAWVAGANAAFEELMNRNYIIENQISDAYDDLEKILNGN